MLRSLWVLHLAGGLAAVVGEFIAIAPEHIQNLVGPKLKTSWRMVSEGAATAEDKAFAQAYVPSNGLAGLLSSLPQGRLFQWNYTGVDALNTSAVPGHFTVCNVHQGGDSIAEYVLASILSWNIRLPQVDAEFRRCTWQSGPSTCVSVPLHKTAKGQTVGIIGLGTIGTSVVERAAAMGMRAVAVTYPLPEAPPAHVAWVGDDSKLPQLMRESDFVVVACPLTRSTAGMVNASSFGSMKSTGVLINIARGPIVVEEDLYNALQRKELGGAVLDIWWQRWTQSWPSRFNYSQLPNVWMTPHMSSDTELAMDEAASEIAQNFDALAMGTPLRNIVRNSTRIGEGEFLV